LSVQINRLLTEGHEPFHQETDRLLPAAREELNAYRESPTQARRARLETDFDRLFLNETAWPELNEVLRKIHGKKSELLLVLDHPEIPLHNNLSENDIRQYLERISRVLMVSFRIRARRLPQSTARPASGSLRQRTRNE
jgi:Transposase IS66 family